MLFVALTPAASQSSDADIFSLSLEELMKQAVFTPSRVPEAISDTPGQVIVVSRRQISGTRIPEP
jgi:hypothetical protein